MPRRRFVLVSVLLGATAATAAEKPQVWIEVRSPHFIVVSNAGEKQARRAADQFEQIRAVFKKALPRARVDPGQDVIILAVKDEKSLKALLPAYWETKGRMHPAGVFQRGPEKHYVALRLDTYGDNSYHVVYHEYVHLLTSLNFQWLPVWLNEGFADFYANSQLGGKEVGLGRPSEGHLRLLQTNRLLPLAALFAADHTSPYYNEENKASIFYAQSWALTHYFLLREGKKRTTELDTYLAMVQSGMDAAEATTRAFGDLKQLEKKLEAYVGQAQFYYMTMKPPADADEKTYAARQLPPAESAAVRGDFHMHTNRPKEARALLDEALRLDRKLALAHEAMGFLHFREGKTDEALRWFEQATELDSRSYLAHYYHAMLLAQRIREEETRERMEKDLRRTIELKPDFAPAYATLAGISASRGGDATEALALARKATELEPGNHSFQIALAHVLLQLDQTEEALKVAGRAMAAAKSNQERTAVSSLFELVRQQRQFAAQRRQAQEEMAAAAAEIERRRKEIEQEEKVRLEPPPAEEPKRPAAKRARQELRPKPGQRVIADGRIAAVSCSAPAVLDLTLDFGSGLTLRLRAPNYHKVEFLTLRWVPPANFNPCVHIRGLPAEVAYALVEGRPYAGEILSVTIQK